VTHGSSTAGGAYQTGIVRLHRDGARPHPGVPGRAAAVESGNGEIATEEELGGAEMHTSISGLGDYLAEDDRDALRIARDIMANLEWDRPKPAEASFKPPRYDAEELLGIMPMDHKRPVDMRRRSRALSTIPTSPSSARITVPRPYAAMPASKGRRSGSSPTTAARRARRQQGDALSSRPAASRARRSSI
jgi:hypothetical protein